MHIPADPVEPYAARNKRYRTGRSASAKPERGAPGAAPEDGWDDNTDPIGVVKDFLTNQEVNRRECV